MASGMSLADNSNNMDLQTPPRASGSNSGLQSPPTVAEETSTNKGPCMPELVDFNVPIQNSDLLFLARTRAPEMKKMLQQKKIETISELAQLTEAEVLKLPIVKPTLQRLRNFVVDRRAAGKASSLPINEAELEAIDANHAMSAPTEMETEEVVSNGKSTTDTTASPNVTVIEVAPQEEYAKDAAEQTSYYKYRPVGIEKPSHSASGAQLDVPVTQPEKKTSDINGLSAQLIAAVESVLAEAQGTIDMDEHRRKLLELQEQLTRHQMAMSSMCLKVTDEMKTSMG
jgi:hypothetical protein